MNELIEIFEKAKRKRWCVSYMCTTCGSRDFRCAVKNLGEDKLYQSLKELNEEEVLNNKNALEVIFNDLRVFPTGLDVLLKVEGTPVHNYFNEIFMYLKSR